MVGSSEASKIGGLRPGAIIFQGLGNASGAIFVRKIERIDLQAAPQQLSEIPSWISDTREKIEIAMDTQVLDTREEFHRVDEETRTEELEKTRESLIRNAHVLERKSIFKNCGCKKTKKMSIRKFKK